MTVNPENIIEKYYQKGSPLYDLLMKHSEQVRDKALVVCKKHPEFGADNQFVAEAAMLHDIGIFLCNAPSIFCYGKAGYIEHGYLGADLLRKEGLEKHALVAERHTGTGISWDDIRKHNLALPEREMQPISIEEKIICYADKFHSKTTPEKELSFDEVAKKLRKFGEEKVAVFEQWQKMFG